MHKTNLCAITLVCRSEWSCKDYSNFDFNFETYGVFFMILFETKGQKPTPIELRATSHTRLRARDQYTSSTLIGGKGRAGPSSLHTTLEGPTECTCECKMDHGCKAYMDSNMASNDSCFMVTWIIS